MSTHDLIAYSRTGCAAVAAKNHSHSRLNPKAQYQISYTVDEVLNDKPIVWPLTRALR